jgi:protein involved in polysaccharide export with SLBB domain
METKQTFKNRLAGWMRNASSAGLIALGLLSTGCSTITQPISGIPARRLPPQFLAQSKNNLVPLDPARLSQEPPRDYLLDDGDILGIYIEGILPFVPPDRPPEPPPVNFPDANSQLDPSLGYPIAVINDGTIQLPNLEPIKVRGLTIDQTRDLIRKYYLDSEILRESSRLQPIVTLMKERTYNVIVIRQDMGGQGAQGGGGGMGGGFTRGTDYSATGRMLKLKAYQNDILNAMMESGGLPGVNAKNEIKILRASRADQRRRDEFVQQFYQQYYCNPDPCGCPPPLPEDPSILRIPLRLPPGVIPSLTPEDVVLEDGDIVYIESRDAEVYYTGGLLPGGEFRIPRDYDLDVLTAMSLSGGGISRSQNGGGMGGMGGIGGMLGTVPPGMLYVLRKTPCNGQITIAVDLAKANLDPRERILVQPGDILILRFKPSEELLNFGLGTFFTFGIQYALREL